jgi:DNA-binding transcriptional regulator YhcF (GntR family)
MAWNLDDGRPIYTQLVERIQMQIVSGQYKPGDKLPSVRELAATAAVNPNTMQRAFAELEGSGLIITQRTNGRNVTENAGLIEEVRQKLARENTDEFFEKMQQLGYDRSGTLEFLKKSFEERD